MNDKEKEEQRRRAVRWVAWLTVGAILIGTAWIILIAWQKTELAQKLSIIGVSAALGGAFFMIGLLLGFIFGYTRKRPKPLESSPTEPIKDVGTNLEQISEWLTKIVVGAGLAQLASLPTSLKQFGEYANKTGLGNLPNGEVFAVGLLIYYLTCGFLSGYLLTRLYFLGPLEE